MLSYCLKCRKNTVSKKPEVIKSKKQKNMLLLNCSVRNSKNLNFLKTRSLRVMK